MFPQKFILFILGLIAAGLLAADPNADMFERDSGEFWEEVYNPLSIGGYAAGIGISTDRKGTGDDCLVGAS